MAALVDYYNWAMNEASDVRTSGWFLMSSPWPMLVLTLLYLFIVWKGPSWMERREAFSLKYILVIYNFGLALLSAYMCWEFFASSFLQPGFNLICEPVDYSNSESALRLASACWWYFFSKIIEFWDTFFFILRKKNNQISFLHVYHHSTMVGLWWAATRYVAGGESYFSAMVNCFIHILMYSYYMLSAMGPHMQKYLWWKKYMTSLQLLQFFVVVSHTVVAFIWQCGYPNGYTVSLIAYMLSLILLFSNFYHKTYIKRNHQGARKSHKHAKNGHVKHLNGYIPVSQGTTSNKQE